MEVVKREGNKLLLLLLLLLFCNTKRLLPRLNLICHVTLMLDSDSHLQKFLPEDLSGFQLFTCAHTSGGSRFSRRSANLVFFIIFPRNCMKLVLGQQVSTTLLDPPMRDTKSLAELNCFLLQYESHGLYILNI